MRPRRRLLGILLAAGVVYLFATNSEVVWLYVVAGMIAALVPVGILAPMRAVSRADITLAGTSHAGFLAPLAQDRARVFVGDNLLLRFPSADPVLSLPRLRLGDGAEVAVADTMAPTGRTLSLGLSRRGELGIRALLVSCDWPLGLFLVQRWVPLRVDVIVYPRYWIHAAERFGGVLDAGQESRRRGEGDDFLGVRDYRAGDSRRRIHWRTTARTGSLMVAETAVESDSPLRLSLRASSGSNTVTELAVSIAASVAAGGVDAGRQIEVDLGDRVPVRRWGELMAQLAMLLPAGSAAQGGGLSVAAGADAVTVTGADGRAISIPGDATLADAALAMLQAL